MKGWGIMKTKLISRVLALMLLTVIIAGAVSCGNGNAETTATTAATTTSTTVTTTTAATTTAVTTTATTAATTTAATTTSTTEPPVVEPTVIEGLVAKWSFEEIAEGVIEDVTGNGHDGNVTGTPDIIDDGHSGKAIQFGGSGQVVVVPDDEAFACADGNYTMTAWIKVFGNEKYQTVFQKGRDSTTNNWAGIWVFTDKYTYGIPNNNLSGPSATGEWQFVAIVCDTQEGARMLYVDGELVATEVFNQLNNTDVLTIGARSNGSEGFIGCVDEAAFYDKALSSEQILALFEE